MDKLITFAVPCYNSAAYMEHCVETLLQGGNDIEIILVDDGSTKDDTPAICDRYAAQYPDIETDYLLVDALSTFMLTKPERFDVIVASNLFGDIITDLAAAVTGGIGLAASGNINMDGTFPSMFEPVHGSAPDIAGTGKANPLATILYAGMMLRYTFGLLEEADAVDSAVRAFLQAGLRTFDIAAGDAAPLTTAETGDKVASFI
jgi:3-isopropylmalate dehydrogenase